jgi:peptide/nickel transport system substrate-binding protein
VYNDHVKDQFWVFKKNPNYWRPGLPHLDSIEFQPIPDDQKRLAALESGDIDIMHTLRPAQVQLLRQQQGQFKMVENNAGEEEMILLNTQKEPFNSLTARQAVAAATDTAGWRHDLMFDVAQAVNSPFAPGQPGYEPDNGYPKFDMAKAKQLVKQYESENKGKKLSFEYATQDDISNSNEGYYFKALYEEAGMEVVVHPLPQINLLGLVAPGHYQASRFRLFGNTNPDVDSRFWLSTSVLPEPNVSLNFPRWVDTSVDSDIYKAMGSTDEGVRDTAYKNIGRNFAKNLPYLWLGRSTWLLAASPRVNGIYSAANGTIDTIGAKTWISELSIDL